MAENHPLILSRVSQSKHFLNGEGYHNGEDLSISVIMLVMKLLLLFIYRENGRT